MDRINSLFGALWGYVYTWLPTTARQWDRSIKLEQKQAAKRETSGSTTSNWYASKRRNCMNVESTAGPSSEIEYPTAIQVPKEILSLKSPPGKNKWLVRSSNQLAVIGSKFNYQRARNKNRQLSFTRWLRQRRNKEVALTTKNKTHEVHGRHEFCYHMNFAIQTKNADEKLEDGSGMHIIEGIRGRRKILRRRERQSTSVNGMTAIVGDESGRCSTKYGNSGGTSIIRHRENVDFSGSIIVIQVKPANSTQSCETLIR